MNRMLPGMIAGFAATLAMTAVMRRMHRLLPAEQRYHLPPRQITDRLGGSSLRSEQSAQNTALAAHFGFGAAAGGLFSLIAPRPSLGASCGYGLLVWALSYLGWIPAAGILPPATRFPARRNMLMLAAHLVWGAALGASLNELEEAKEEILSRKASEQFQPASGRD